MTVAFKALKYKTKITRNSAIADKPRHEFVQLLIDVADP